MPREQCDKLEVKSLYRDYLGFFCAALFLLTAVIYSPIHAEEAEYTLFTPPGELVDIGSHRLHINCKGTGTPTVLIDSGMGGFSLEWKTIHESLANHFTTCTYDRAGYGWSDPGPSPRTSSQIAGELYQLIEAKRLPGPYILVGHSFGGYNMRYFASKHSEITAGLILVDASHPEQFDRMDLKPVIPKEVKRPNSIRYTISRPIMHMNYPGDVKSLAYRLLTSQKSHFTRLNELENFELSAKQVAESAAIPNVPLVVLSRGKRVWPYNKRGDKMERVWEELQGELSYLSNISIQITATNSGHSIHLDQPELVRSAIMNTVAASRHIKYERLTRLAQGENPNVASAFSLYEYFDLATTGGQLGGKHKYHEAETVYYDATIALAIRN